MKKTNLITLSTLIVAVLLVVAFASCRSVKNENKQGVSVDDTKILENSEQETNSSFSALPTENTNTVIEITTTEDNNLNTQPALMNDALFIGDSRTVGIMEYSGLKEANYFCRSGMNVFAIKKERVSVPNIGKVTLDELLSNKKYGKIYIMLGINELGYEFERVVNKYNELIEFIEEKQSDAIIIIQANLHVSKKRSDSDNYINNKNINKLNDELKKIANGKNIFFIDANYLFDDDGGNLSSDKTSDNAHLYAKYYVEWGEWICTETAKVCKED